ncbi:MAG: hypothetical protein HYV99_02255 [Betaproteobacteria bacterium]|nr:hypothetical protein [Betaproteobacteria bacterium]
MPAREQAGDGEPDLALLAEDDAADLGDDFFDFLGHITVAAGLSFECATGTAAGCCPYRPADSGIVAGFEVIIAVALRVAMSRMEIYNIPIKSTCCNYNIK